MSYKYIEDFVRISLELKTYGFATGGAVRKYNHGMSQLRQIVSTVDNMGTRSLDEFAQLLSHADPIIRQNCAWLMLYLAHFSTKQADTAVKVIEEENSFPANHFLSGEWYCGSADTVYLKEWYLQNKDYMQRMTPIIREGESGILNEFIAEAYSTMLPRLSPKLSANRNKAKKRTDSIAMLIVNEAPELIEQFALLMRHDDYVVQKTCAACILRLMRPETPQYQEAVKVLKHGLEINELLYYGMKHWLNKIESLASNAL